MNPKRLIALTRGGIMESLYFRLGIFVTLFANLIYLVLVYYLWKAIYASSGSDVVNGMSFNDTMIYLILATALFNFLEMFVVWDMSRSIQSGKIVLDLLKPMRFRKYTYRDGAGTDNQLQHRNARSTHMSVYRIDLGHQHRQGDDRTSLVRRDDPARVLP